jgi:flagellar hook-associated protein 2
MVTSAISGSTPDTSTSNAPTATGPTATSVTGSAGVVTQSISGLASGLDDNEIISELVAAQRSAEEDPVNAQIASANSQLLSYAQIDADATTLQAAARALSSPTAWQALTATSSNPNAVTVSAGTGTSTGNLSFTVDRLATAGSVRSANVFTSTAAPLTSNPAILLATGGQALGFSTFASDPSVTLGSHTIAVTQASAGALKVGNGALATSTVIDGTNDTLQLSIDGNPLTLTLAHGSYTATQLAAAVQTAATAAGAAINATVDPNTGALQLVTTEEGSAANLQVTGGNALTALNMSTDGAALSGIDGKVQVDGGAIQTVTDVVAGQSITLNAPAGTISAAFSGGLRTGSITASNISTGDGSLGTVVANINSANVGVLASAVQVGTNQYRLQLTSNATGVLNDLNVDGSDFNASSGGLVTVNAAADAQLTIGSGTGAFTVNSASNVVTGLLAGATLTLVGVTGNAGPVTVSTANDAQGLATKVQALVDAANALHTTIASVTAYDPTTNTAQPLTGDFATLQLANSLATSMEDAVAGSDPVSPDLAGVTEDQNGVFSFDQSTFLAAYNSDPTGMAKLFTQGGTSSNPNLTFISAADTTQGGSYDVNVSQAAAHATSVGLNGTWPTGADSSIAVSIGTNQITYEVKATDTQADVVSGLNSAFANAGLSLGASVNGTGIEVDSVGYGHTSSFAVAWDGTNFTTATGTDIAGTINGITATGSGQQLMIPFGTPGSGGLALNITGTTLGDLGTFTYSPGIAQRVSTAVTAAIDPVSGSIATSQSDLNTQIASFNQQISDMEDQLTQYQTTLQNEFTNMESVIAGLKATGSTLTSALAGLPSFNGTSSSG